MVSLLVGVVLAVVAAAVLRLIGVGFETASRFAIAAAVVFLALRLGGVDVLVDLEVADVPPELWEILKDLLQGTL